MFSRSFRLFNFRISVRCALVNTDRYHAFVHPLSDFNDWQDAGFHGKSLPELVKGLPDVTEELGELYAKDVRVVLCDMDNDGEQVKDCVGHFIPLRIIRKGAFSVSEVRNLK